MRIGFGEGEENARAANNRVRFSIAGICSLYMDRAVIYRAASCGKKKLGWAAVGRTACRVVCFSFHVDFLYTLGQQTNDFQSLVATAGL
jgi:hypothetical protein